MRSHVEPDLHHVDGPSVETRSAVCEVVAPHPHEPLVESERAHLWQHGLETITPLGKRASVARAEEPLGADRQAALLR